MLDKVPVAVIGATGAVGQRFVQQLEGHPWFELEIVAASDRSAGKMYGDFVNWVIPEHMPEIIINKEIQSIDPKLFKNVGIELIFSALPAEIAKDAEFKLMKEGFKIFSNASSHRMAENVPLLIADINPDHLALVEQQLKNGPGFIVTNPNCTIAGLATALKPLAVEFGIKNTTVATYQALSGAGYPGISSMDIVGNVIPYIPNEEEKVENECQKILGALKDGRIEPYSFEVYSNCARVPVRDGHLEAVVVELGKDVEMDELIRAFGKFNALGTISLPTVPNKAIVFTSGEDRPQPILDIYTGTPVRAKGMAITIGRIKIFKNKKKLRLFLLVHNTIRGAAGCSIMNAELAKYNKYL